MKNSLAVLTFLLAFVLTCDASYRVGMGIWDVTGPPAEVNMMGMGDAAQRTSGLHTRLRSRAVIVEDADTSTRIAYVTNNLCMTYGGMMQNITAKLQAKYGTLYGYENVMVSGEHTHSGPAGFTYMSLYDITSFGFHEENFMTIVDGIVSAISMAHDNLVDGRILINNGTLPDSNISRSAYSYTFNPQSEQNAYDSNTDKNMTVLRFEDSQGSELGLLSFFAVHGTSMNNTNRLISGDNKGFAAYYTEKIKNGASSVPGMGPFIAGFAQCNEGDVSPNTLGAFCPDGSPCDPRSSTCMDENGKARVELCRGYGPGESDFEATRIIGTNQADFALHLYDNAVKELSGNIAYVHAFVNMENVTVTSAYSSTGQKEKTCSACLGDSFAAGTTDGPGMFNFQQGTNSTSTNKFWNEFAYTFLARPSQETVDCQAPKPILLNTGIMHRPAPWTASVVPIQIFKIGEVFLLGVPGEFTTMSGRRLRASVMDALQRHNLADENSHVIVAGLSNEYTHYITTYEEYQIQRYEAASTLYGPHTLAAYQQEFDQLVATMANNGTYLDGPAPLNLNYVHWCALECDRGPDGVPSGFDFGSINVDVNSSYSVGSTASVSFWGGNPDNNYMTQGTYLTVDVMNQTTGDFETILYDGDWDTKMHWARKGVDHSLITIEWTIATGTPAGQYRITHSGYSRKPVTGRLHSYEGISSTFTVTQ